MKRNAKIHISIKVEDLGTGNWYEVSEEICQVAVPPGGSINAIRELTGVLVRKKAQSLRKQITHIKGVS